MAKNRIIGVRVDEGQSEQFERAAKAAGKKVSDWLRELAVRAIAPPPDLGTMLKAATEGREGWMPIAADESR